VTGEGGGTADHTAMRVKLVEYLALRLGVVGDLNAIAGNLVRSQEDLRAILEMPPPGDRYNGWVSEYVNGLYGWRHVDCNAWVADGLPLRCDCSKVPVAAGRDGGGGRAFRLGGEEGEG